MSEPNELREQVLTSLRERPTLNTPTLIAGGEHVPDDVATSAIEVELQQLVTEGLVKHRPTGWKLAPEAG